MKIQKFWNSLNQTTVVSRRDLFLGITVCALAGLALGMIISPKKTVMISCYNGNTHNNISCPDADENQISPETETDEPPLHTEGA